MDLEALQDKYHHKIVRVKSFYKFPEVNYEVTAIVEDGDGFILAVRDVNYSRETKRWYTIHCHDLEDLERAAGHFEVLDVRR